MARNRNNIKAICNELFSKKKTFSNEMKESWVCSFLNRMYPKLHTCFSVFLITDHLFSKRTSANSTALSLIYGYKWTKFKKVGDTCNNVQICLISETVPSLRTTAYFFITGAYIKKLFWKLYRLYSFPLACYLDLALLVCYATEHEIYLILQTWLWLTRSDYDI